MKPPFYGHGKFLLLWLCLVVWDAGFLAWDAVLRDWLPMGIMAVLLAWAVYGVASTSHKIGRERTIYRLAQQLRIPR